MIIFYRKVAVLEAYSYLFLILVAMPVKYLLHIPELVKYFGWIHGVLAILFVIVLLITAIQYKWSIWRVITYGVASVVPLIPFYFDKKIEEEYKLK